MWITFPSMMTATTLSSFTGLVIYAYYRQIDCDPVTSGRIRKNDEIVPLFIMDTLSKAYGIPGLFLSCVAAGTLSTISSNLNSMAAVTLEDYVKRLKLFRLKPGESKLSESKATLVSRSLAFCYGVLVIALSFGFSFLSNTHLIDAALSVFGATGGPLLGIFTLGMLSRRANRQGGLIGFLFGALFACTICIGAQIQPNPRSTKLFHNFTDRCNFTLPASNSTSASTNSSNFLFSLSYMWYGLIGFTLTFAFGWATSLLWKSDRVVEKRLLAFQGKRSKKENYDEIEEESDVLTEDTADSEREPVLPATNDYAEESEL
ncbi:putative sodium-dependent multivitamin transporter [Oscarella lobularis]|uniref:putative sodium-dependent multivitamin transporter n=1 Tax=Oscarella lobularis TaxID=121494 RepID=UPI0033143929